MAFLIFGEGSDLFETQKNGIFVGDTRTSEETSMRRLIKNIEQVLYREECVVIPGVGAFLRHNASASIDGGKGLIYPGHSHLSFNAALQQNDGVLVRQYMSVFSMGYKKALSLLESDIHEFREDLQRYWHTWSHSISQMIR